MGGLHAQPCLASSTWVLYSTCMCQCAYGRPALYVHKSKPACVTSTTWPKQGQLIALSNSEIASPCMCVHVCLTLGLAQARPNYVHCTITTTVPTKDCKAFETKEANHDINFASHLHQTDPKAQVARLC